MDKSRRELSIDMVNDRDIFKNRTANLRSTPALPSFQKQVRSVLNEDYLLF